MHPVDLIRKFPKITVALCLAIFFVAFGWKGFLASICGILCVTIIAYILTDDDNDWFDPRGPRPA